MKTNNSKRQSVIAAMFATFTAWIYSMAADGFFGKLLTSYREINASFKESFAASLAGGNSAFFAFMRRLRLRIAEMFEMSVMLHLWRKIANFLVGCRMRFYGSFTLIFAIYTFLIYLVKRFAFTSDISNVGYVIAAAVLLIASIPMIISKKSVAECLLESRLGHLIVVDILGIPEEKLKTVVPKHGDSYNLAIIFGLVLGTLTYFVHPALVIALAAFFAAMALIMTYPEIGVLLTVLLLPFFGLLENGSIFFDFCVELYTFSYFIKLVRGKRILRLEIYDLLMLVFGGLIMLGGLVGVGDGEEFEAAYRFAIILLGSFVAQNLIRTEIWAKRYGRAVFISGFLVSLLEIFFFVLARIDLTFIGVNFSLSNYRVFTLFGERDALAAYLVIAFAIILSVYATVRNKRLKLLYRISMITIPVALALMPSPSGVFGILVALLVYFYLVKRRTFSVLFGSCLAAAYALYMIPQKWISALTSVIYPYITALWQNISVWQGTFGAVLTSLFVGSGVGTFAKVYPIYAQAGSENATQSASVFLRLMLELGIPGLLIFFAVIIIAAQKCLEYIKSPVSKESKLAVAAGLCAMVGALAQGMFFDIFCDTRAFYMFWFAIAYTLAVVRIGQNEATRKMSAFVSSDSAASVDVV